jgi:protein-disulfide isomerase
MAELTKQEKRELAKEEKRKEREKGEFQSGFKKWLIYLVVLAVIGFFGYKVYAFFTAPLPEVVEQPVNVVETDWVKGAGEAEATLIEYGDFQCPACATYYPMVKQLLDEYPDTLRVVYRHFPLPSHRNAYPAAQAAEAAGRQDKFWEMHDILFERQSEWSNLSNPQDKFEEYAEELELDMEQFVTDYESEEAREKIDADLLSATQLGVNATPTFYLNGKKLAPVRSYQDFSSRVQEEIDNDSDGN